MHPVLFHFTLPSWLHSTTVNIYSYAFFVTLGALATALYINKMAKKELGIRISNSFYYIVFIAGFVVGKLFYYLEHPMQYINNPSLLLANFNGGYVFYGSFLLGVPTVIWYFKRKGIAVLPMLDILAFAPIIADAFGRVGCFFAGCCYGSPTHATVGMVFPTSHNLVVHPTQLYEVVVLIAIMTYLLFIKRQKQFNGQIFILYMALYAVCRGGLEFFRGDDRGYIIDGILSQAQFIGLLLLAAAIIFYYKLKQQSLTLKLEK